MIGGHTMRAVPGAARRFLAFSILMGIIGFGMLAWATDGFQKPLDWDDFRNWRHESR